MNDSRWMTALAALLVTVGCQAATGDDAPKTKTPADPDAELTGAADALSNRFTTVIGDIEVNGLVQGGIDYPDWYHGYHIDLTEGQQVQFTVWASATGLVRLYGPGIEDSRGRYHYSRAVVRSHTDSRGDRYNVDFDFMAEQGGRYLLVYGPDYVWSADYELSTKCLVGCDETAEITVSDVLADPRAYDGKRVTITGNVFAGPAFCTQLACSPSNPCCNSCGADQNLYDGSNWAGSDGLSLRRDGEMFGCGGDECTVADSCTVESGRYEVVGTVSVEPIHPSVPDVRAIFDVETLSKVEAPCEDDSECADGWCRLRDWSADSPHVCVPFVDEGAWCSGFAPANVVDRCAPELTCVFEPFVQDAPGICRNTPTIQEVIAEPAKFDGVRVSIDGWLGAGASACTRIGCSADDPCCNSCSSTQTLVDPTGVDGAPGVRLHDGATGSSYRCSADSCGNVDTCTTTFGAQENIRVLGTVRDAGGTAELHVETIESLDWIN